MTLFLQISLVASETREAKKLFAGETPKLCLCFTVITNRLFVPSDLLVEIEIELEVGEEHVILLFGGLCKVEVRSSTDGTEIDRLFFKAQGAQIVKAGQEFGV